MATTISRGCDLYVCYKEKQTNRKSILDGDDNGLSGFFIFNRL